MNFITCNISRIFGVKLEIKSTSVKTQHLNPSPVSFPLTSTKLRMPLNWNEGPDSSPCCFLKIIATGNAAVSAVKVTKMLLHWCDTFLTISFLAEVSSETKEGLVRATWNSSWGCSSTTKELERNKQVWSKSDVWMKKLHFKTSSNSEIEGKLLHQVTFNIQSLLF